MKKFIQQMKKIPVEELAKTAELVVAIIEEVAK